MDYKNIFYRFAEFSGVKIFKQYFPVCGSYWNSHHINKNSKKDMQTLIYDSWTILKIHYFSAIFIFMSSGKHLFNIDKSAILYLSKFYIPLSYTMMVQIYNIKKAEDRLENIVKNEEPVKERDYSFLKD